MLAFSNRQLNHFSSVVNFKSLLKLMQIASFERSTQNIALVWSRTQWVPGNLLGNSENLHFTCEDNFLNSVFQYIDNIS